MVEDVLPDGRSCRLALLRLPTAPDGRAADLSAPRLVIRCEVDGSAPVDVPLDASWDETSGLPPGLVELIIRHFLLR